MSKRKNIKYSNIPFTYGPNYYSWGGDFKNTLNLGSLKDSFSGANVANMLKGGLAGGIGSAVGKIGGGLISGGLQSGAGNAIGSVGSTIGGIVGTVNPLAGAAVSAASGIFGGITNALFGSKLNKEKIAEIEGINSQLNTLNIDDSSFDAIQNMWTNQDFGNTFTRSDIGKDGLFSNKAKNTFNRLSREQAAARNRALLAYDNAVINADTNSDLMALANFSAYGGPLNTYSQGGKIHIKPSKRGTFTAAAKKHGKGVQEFASQVLANKEDYSPAMVKKANFARNASKWKHADGGPLFAYGAEWNNGITKVNNGGTHEENPMEGVRMGADNMGIPNLVEEGEVIWNDYVFSNRLKVPKEVRDKYKFNKKKALTFADAAEYATKESEERPNDPISKRGLEAAMARLQQAQEFVRQDMQDQEGGNKYAYGGRLGNLFAGPGEYSQYLNGWKPYGAKYSLAEESPYYEEPPSNPKKDVSDPSLKDAPDFPWKDKSYLTGLRYAPVVGAAIGIGQNLFSKPDYSNANAVLEAANQVGNYNPIGYTPVGNYLQYNPFDRNYYLNKLGAQAGATRSAIMNSLSPSRDASLLAADYNAQTKMGELARQAEEYNLAQRQAVETFNRQTNLSNAEMGLKAAMANQEAAMKARSGKLSGVAQAMAMKDAIDARRAASMSANLTNLFESLGNIGIDEANRRDRDFYVSTMGATLPISEYAYLNGRDATVKEYINRYGKNLTIQKMLEAGANEKDLKKYFSPEDIRNWSNYWKTIPNK